MADTEAGDRVSYVTMKHELLDTAVLVRNVPEHGLQAGDLGEVVKTYPPDGLDVGLVTASGRTTALVTWTSDVRAISGYGPCLCAHDRTFSVSAATVQYSGQNPTVGPVTDRACARPSPAPYAG